MRNPALVVAALALLASVVTGREGAVVATPAAPAEPPRAEQKDDVDLDVAKLARERGQSEIPDLFANRAPVQAAPMAAPAVVAKPAPPPPPTAPPLPFKYIGRMVDGGKVVVFLERNQQPLSATAGMTLEGTYQVESIAESAVHFVYLPLGAKQVLNTSAPN